MPIELVDPVITGTLSNAGSVSGSLSSGHGVSGTITVGGSSDLPEYEGAYTITPGTEAQTLDTAYKITTDQIVIEAIPNNYGLITWNGSYLTVS